jgi:hypothetical protein
MNARAPWTAFALAGLAACQASPPNDSEIDRVARQLRADYGNYDAQSVYAGNVDDTRGWTIEWQVPGWTDPSDAPDNRMVAIGQWYYNLETGIGTWGNHWSVYYFGDDNGLAGNQPKCFAPDGTTTWGVGSVCDQAAAPNPFTDLQPGQHVVFKYEWCTTAHVASVTGSRLCAYVDLKDGHGYRFLAEDVRGTNEMAAHDNENWAEARDVKPRISCSAPLKMVRQQLKNAAGAWVDMTGTSTWRFTQTTPYAFQNRKLTATAASWDSCSPAPDGTGNGLHAEYFNSPDLSGSPLVRIDPTIEFEWGAGSPDRSIHADNFSTRWTGQIEPRFSERYTLSTFTDGGVRVWLNGKLIIDRWTYDYPTGDDGLPVSLVAGQRYDVKVEYVDQSGDATAKLLWSSPSQPTEVIPRGHLFTTGTAVPSLADLAVLDDSPGADGIVNQAQWTLERNFKVGSAPFGDRPYTIASVGNSALLGKTWIRTAADSKSYAGSSLGAVRVNGSFVNLLIDKRHNAANGRPAWLTDTSYVDQGYDVVVRQSSTTTASYRVWRRPAVWGSMVALPKVGSSVAPCYLVVVQ